MKFFKSFTQYGTKALVVEHDNGKDFYREIPLEPTLYVSGRGDFRTIHGEVLKPIKFNDTKSARDFAKSFGNGCYGFDRFSYALINDTYGNDYDLKKIKGVYIDIENAVTDAFPNIETADTPINCVTLFFNGTYFCYTTLDITGIEIPSARIVRFNSEAELLAKFVQHWSMIRPDWVSGWNCQGYDMPYIAKRVEVVLGKDDMKRLSPFGLVKFNIETDDTGRVQHSVNIAGVQNLDMMVLYKKFRLITRESYKLDFIAEVELKDKKIEIPGSFYEQYTNHPAKFVEYNIHDVRLVKNLNDKLNFIDMVMSVAYIAKVNYEDTLSNVRVWDVMIHNYLLELGVCVPFTKAGGVGEGYEGAFVKDPIRGFYEWLVSFDLESLYPSIIIQNNISPETVLRKDLWPSIRPSDIIDRTDKWAAAKEFAESHDATLSGNGVLCSRKVAGFIPILAERIFDKRKAAKKKKLEYKRELELIEAEIIKRRG
jgi:DNA polymerase elongation subunit (family B)